MAEDMFNCTGMVPTMAAMCSTLNTQAAAAAAVVTCGYNQYSLAGVCTNYTSIDQKVAGMLGDQAYIDIGNTAWMLMSSALVMIMTPGLGFFYSGLAGAESAANTIMMSYASMVLVTVQWFAFGYSFSFGPGTAGWGTFDWGAMTSVGLNPSAAYGWNIPHLLWAIFQCMFAQITPALISGAVVGRMKFSSYLVFIFIWTSVIYDGLAHWVWSFTLADDYVTIIPLGFLGKLGAIDFAGGTVIHISSGFAALAAALVLGKRHNHKDKLHPHNVPLVVIGTALLWFGWFGFNAGSAGGATSATNNSVATIAFFNTHLATAAAAGSWMVVDFIVEKKASAVGGCAGAVAGLVAITPACGFVMPWAAVIIGLLVSPFCILAVKVRERLDFDDTLDAFAVHGIGGVWGAFATGLFATVQVNTLGFNGAFYGNGQLLGFQIAAILVSSCYSFFGTVFILMLLKHTMGIRVTDDAEKAGLDTSEHGAQAYVNKTEESVEYGTGTVNPAGPGNDV